MAEDVWGEKYLCEFGGAICEVEIIKRSSSKAYLKILSGFARLCTEPPTAKWISREEFEKDYKIIERL